MSATDDNQKDIVKEAVKQFVEASMHGDKPDLDEFVKQYPGLENQTRKGIQELNKINNLFDSLVKTEDSDFENIEDIINEHDLVGKKVGNFEIVNIIGCGGMGVVYLAKDTKLKRSVAVKSIPAALAGDSTARMRFKREAELLASLNHPNIAVIHEIVEEEKSGYLILEHVEGQTLTERIARGPLKLDEALSIGKQVAEAISAAHKKGVIHRDLKPANIKITPDGQVKVLDFGLAKTTVTEGGSSDVTEIQAGHIIGTPAYMSPEQARGQPIDKRSDIWSFGCMLYEMLTGKIMFEGETASDTLANILKTEPDFEPLPVSTPANIRVLLRRCLQKDPSQRLHDIADARIEISETQSGTLEAFALPTKTATDPRLFRLDMILVALVCLVIGVLIAGVIFTNLDWPGSIELAGVSRLSIPIKTLRLGDHSSLAISPDGSRFVFVGRGMDEVHQLYVRSLDDLEFKPIAGTVGARNPFFSPDGRWIGFFATESKSLMKVSLDDGKLRPLLEDISGWLYGSWAEDGTIVYSSTDGRLGLRRISEEGGKPEILMSTNPEESRIFYPQVLPGGSTILYTRDSTSGGRSIEVYFPETGKSKTMLDKACNAKYVRSGHLIFQRNDLLEAAPFDLKQLKITGHPVPFPDDVKLGRVPQIAFARNETFLYALGSERYKYELVWIDRQGGVESLAVPELPYAAIRLSPDERQIALHVFPPKGNLAQVYLYDIKRSILIHLTTDGGVMPVWSPDGTQIAFSWDGDKGFGVYGKSVGRSAPPELLATAPFTRARRFFPHSWSPDGKHLACTAQSKDPNSNDRDIWIIHLESDRKPYILRDTEKFDYNPAFSPNGRWLAYVSNESGRAEVYIKSFPDLEVNIQVSSGGGVGPIWARDGSELYYMNDKTMMAVQIGMDTNSPAGAPEQLFTLEGPYSTTGFDGRTYDVSEDGRFLMCKRRSEDLDIQLICVRNWFEELKRLAPSDEGE